MWGSPSEYPDGGFGGNEPAGVQVPATLGSSIGLEGLVGAVMFSMVKVPGWAEPPAATKKGTVSGIGFISLGDPGQVSPESSQALPMQKSWSLKSRASADSRSWTEAKPWSMPTSTSPSVTVDSLSTTAA